MLYLDDFGIKALTFLFIFILLIFAISSVHNFITQRRLNERLSQAGINDIDNMNGVEFERYLSVLFANLGFKPRQTKASNDFGADLVLEGTIPVVVQAKRYSKRVGIRAVQEIHSARDFYNAQEAWVVTNNFFTLPAIKLAKTNNVRLIDRYELVDLILESKSSSENKKHFWNR